jgi:DNA polymerase V
LFALIDCNNFYASCERVFRPDLAAQPIVVLSNNDGCIIARSNEAKALGIPMGAAAFQYQPLFEQHKINVFSANFALYGDMSQRVMSILSTFCSDIEIYSIDEAFLDFTGLGHLDLKQYALQICKTVLRCTGIAISVGIANTKTLAKAANRIAKKFPAETQGVHLIDDEEKRLKALRWLHVEDIWGIGRQHTQRLQHIGVRKAIDFVNLPDEWIYKHMSIVGLRLKKELNGLLVNGLEHQSPKKNIATTRSFEKDYDNFAALKERIVTFAVACAEKLRRQNSVCRALMVFVLTNRYRNDLPQYQQSITVQLPYATNSSIDIAKYAIIGLEKIFKTGFRYKKAGVVIMDFCSDTSVQTTMFQTPNPRHQKLMQCIDHINKNHGQQKVKLATQDTKRIWKMRQEQLSPRYSTRLSDIICVNA